MNRRVVGGILQRRHFVRRRILRQPFGMYGKVLTLGRSRADEECSLEIDGRLDSSVGVRLTDLIQRHRVDLLKKYPSIAPHLQQDASSMQSKEND